jgi:hypothetical protein
MQLFELYTFFQNEDPLDMKHIIFVYSYWTAYYINLLFCSN